MLVLLSALVLFITEDTSDTHYLGRKAPSLKMQTVCLFVLFCFFVIVVVGVELSDWLAPLIITLFARGDHVWAKYSGQMT